MAKKQENDQLAIIDCAIKGIQSLQSDAESLEQTMYKLRRRIIEINAAIEAMSKIARDLPGKLEIEPTEDSQPLPS